MLQQAKDGTDEQKQELKGFSGVCLQFIYFCLSQTNEGGGASFSEAQSSITRAMQSGDDTKIANEIKALGTNGKFMSLYVVYLECGDVGKGDITPPSRKLWSDLQPKVRQNITNDVFRKQIEENQIREVFNSALKIPSTYDCLGCFAYALGHDGDGGRVVKCMFPNDWTKVDSEKHGFFYPNLAQDDDESDDYKQAGEGQLTYEFVSNILNSMIQNG